MKISFLNKPRLGFTLQEIIIAIAISILIVLTVISIFSVNQTTFRKTSLRSELTQNGRVALDIMSREIRQAREIVTVLPADNSNPETVSHELMLEDGHISTQIQYIRYYLSGNSLNRQTIVYYFDTDPDTYVYWNDINAFGSPDSEVIDDRVIGENFTQVDFYGEQVINIDLTLSKQNETEQIKAIINPRNI